MSVIKNLTKTFKDFEIQIDELNVSDEGVTMIWGSSGAGKTTLIRLLTGLESCPGFEWHMGGIDIAKLSPADRKVSVVFQHLALFPHLTARENILFPLNFYNKPVSFEKDWHDLEQLLQLTSFLDRKTHVLSGGESQRVALARALVVQPRLLILDEPFTALDFQLKKQARELLKNIVRERNIPVWLVSHDPMDVESLAQRVVILEKGRIKASQTPEEFLKL